MIEQASQSCLSEAEHELALSRAAELLQLLENTEALLGSYVSPEQYAAVDVERLCPEPIDLTASREPNTPIAGVVETMQNIPSMKHDRQTEIL